MQGEKDLLKPTNPSHHPGKKIKPTQDSYPKLAGARYMYLLPPISSKAY
jgi:hypothetical protein